MQMTRHWSALTLAVALVLIVGCASTPQKNCVTQLREPMTLRTLHSILEEQASSLDGEAGEWRLTYQGVPMALLTSLQHDRMRIIAPIVRQEEVTEQQRGKILDANFHATLDGRYATSQGIVYAAYIHPLSPLDRAQVRSYSIKPGGAGKLPRLGNTDPRSPDGTPNQLASGATYCSTDMVGMIRPRPVSSGPSMVKSGIGP